MSDSIVKIAAEDLRTMDSQEGLVLQGCGEPLQEWLDGINSMLAENGILLNGSRFESASVFQHDGLTNLLFSFEGVELDMGKLAMWRLQTHGRFGGTWLSDYVPNCLGGFIEQPKVPQKPKMELLDQDGNIFAILGRASMLLKEAGKRDQIDEMFQRCAASGSYGKALGIIGEYVDMDLPEPSIEPQKSQKKKARSAYER